MLLSLRGLAPVGGVDGEAAMKRGAGYRKANYAAYVNINMPGRGWALDHQETKRNAFFTNKDAGMANENA